jgi:hypothetical protein
MSNTGHVQNQSPITGHKKASDFGLYIFRPIKEIQENIKIFIHFTN